MTASVYIDMPAAGPLAERFAAAGVVMAADRDSAALTIRQEAGRQSDMDVLYADGWIACETARATADRLDIALPAMGELLELLNVKVRQCGLGCF